MQKIPHESPNSPSMPSSENYYSKLSNRDLNWTTKSIVLRSPIFISPKVDKRENFRQSIEGFFIS